MATYSHHDYKFKKYMTNMFASRTWQIKCDNQLTSMYYDFILDM
jgi:hypothetical protein